MGSGNLGLIYLMDEPRRMTMEEIDERHPDLLGALRAHPHVGWLLVRSAEHGAVALGAGGANYLSEGRVEGEDPLAQFSPTAAAHLLRTDGFTHVADIMVNSFYDEQLDEGCAFEELISFHGGMGGPQTRPFLLHPGGAGRSRRRHHRRRGGAPCAGGVAPRAAGAGGDSRRAGRGADAGRGGRGRAGRELTVRLRPRRLNTAIAALFMIGSFGFALGCVSAYASAVGPTADAVTFFVASIFFTTASFWQLVQSQSPGVAATGTASRRRAAARPLPCLAAARQGLAGRGHAVPRHALLQRDDVLGDHGRASPTASTTRSCGGRTSTARSCSWCRARSRSWRSAGSRSWRPRDAAWWVAWLNMIGSVAFMASAIGAFVIPKTGCRGRPHAGRPRHPGGRRLLLHRRPARHPGVAAGRGGRRSGGWRRGGRAHLRRRGRLTTGWPQASCFFFSSA